MKRIRQPFDIKALIGSILIACVIFSVPVALFTIKENALLRRQNKALLERDGKLPEAFGGVGYISEKTDSSIDVVGYGRFVINKEEAQFLDKGDKAPQYILERGAH